MDSIKLYYREGSSDKVYHANIKEEPSGFIVQFAYGRRGSSLTTGTKTPKPIPFDQAKKIYDKLIQEKTAKGYIEDPSGKPFATTTSTDAKQDTGFRCQLLNEIGEDEVEKYLNDDDWCAQEKFDGRRRSYVVRGIEVRGTNRKGLVVPIEAEVTHDILFKLMPISEAGANFILDGEDMSDHTMIFDCPIIGKPYSERYQMLTSMFDTTQMLKKLKLVSTAWTSHKKKVLYKRLQRENAEGIVFKNIHAGFTPGRPNSGGDQVKFKFVATATVQVIKTNPTKRSVLVAVFDTNGNKIEVGNVTVYPNQEIPKAGTIAEVRYLYYFPGGSLFQPVLLGERDDMTLEDCTLSQLKEKRETVDQ